jgi:predicted  nucleic acid-binding Zn-ribbon protein
MIIKKIKTYFQAKGNDIMKKKLSIDSKLKMAEQDLKNSKEKLIDKIIEINSKKKKFERKLENLEDENMRESYKNLIKKLELAMEPLIKKKIDIDKQLDEFDYKRDKLESQFELLKAQKEIKELNLSDLKDDDLFTELIDEIENSISDYEDEIESINELVDKGVIK